MSDPVETVARFLATSVYSGPSEPNAAHLDEARELLADLLSGDFALITDVTHHRWGPDMAAIGTEWAP